MLLLGILLMLTVLFLEGGLASLPETLLAKLLANRLRRK
jgi:hypothetical protein